MQKQLLIAIEGIDGSGKGTQTAMLENRLRNEGRNVSLFSFPRYASTFFGKEVGKYLDGQYGSLEAVNPKFSSLLYALDRFETSPLIEDALNRNEIVICDRYMGSNVAHQCARAASKENADELANWIETVESKILGTRRPDITILLDIDVDQSKELVAQKEKRSYTDKSHDLHEVSSDHLKNAQEQFRQLAKIENWQTVYCNHPSGAMRSKSEISDEIFNLIKNYK